MIQRHLKNTIARLIHASHGIQLLHQIHSQILTSPNLSSHHRSFLVSRLLLQLSAAASSPLSLPYAARIFALIPNPSLFAYNAIIRASATKSSGRQCFILYRSLLRGGLLPDSITLPFVLKECSKRADMSSGRALHAHSFGLGYESNVYVQNSLIALFLRGGELDSAVELFREMEGKNIITWNSVITGLAQGGRPREALDIFREMQEKGIPDKDVLAWTAVISVLALNGLGHEALGVFAEMEGSGVGPNAVTFVALLSACVHCGLVDGARRCFDRMKRAYGIRPGREHYACMVDVLGRAGLFSEAEELIGSMAEEPDVYVWGALLGGCRLHGNVGLGERVAQKLIELEPENHAFYVLLCDLYAKCGRFGDRERVRGLMRERDVWKTVPGSSVIEVGGVVHEFSVGMSGEDLEGVLMALSSEMKMETELPIPWVIHGEDTAIQLQPVFAQWIQNTHALAPSATAPGAMSSTGLTWGSGDLVAVGGKVALLPIPLGTADFLVHHIHAFTIHVTILILLKGVLFARCSRLIPDKANLGFRFPCDGPGRGASDSFIITVDRTPTADSHCLQPSVSFWIDYHQFDLVHFFVASKTENNIRSANLNQPSSSWLMACHSQPTVAGRRDTHNQYVVHLSWFYRVRI
ncbi:Pentatricopeptide repeat-containing protein [Striga hermonthica]|uniref:Pentatricopeptide repeat-containing protein n=1 Tax=Striga hermonthica TaxID=68872 RepID=A0A9N7RP50_STRHE|nr:Pentatricopeptide repeat-containing protein [Striga hermonthica]